MKTLRLKHFIPVIAVLITSSCTEMLYTSLDVLRPAKVEFAASANHLLVVNNTTPQPMNMGHRLELLNQKTKSITLETDSLPLFCLASLTEELDSKGFFKTVQMEKKSQNSSSNFLTINPLENETVGQLCKNYNADVVLSLDKIKVNDDISEYYLNESNSFLAVFEVRYDTYWSIHYPNSNDVKTIQFKDTIYWENSSYARKNVMKNLPNRMDGVIDGALNAGKKSAGRIVPYWDKVDRYIFKSSNKFIRQGLDSVYVKNWTAAINIWQKAYRSSNSMTKAYAANNMAVAYEITGDLPKAIGLQKEALVYYGNSYFTDNTIFTKLSRYLEDLVLRNTEIEALKLQLGEK
jgi:hypothetical protein